MPLLNYTTTVPADRTIALVHRLLVRAGARQIGTEYDADHEPMAVAFTIETPSGPRAFTLPIDVAAVQKALTGQKVNMRYRTADHARRVAWRIIKDWLEAQLAIIESQMVSFDEVMLPYMRVDGDLTLRDQYRLSQRLELGP